MNVRNRFFSAADGSLFRISPERDANSEVHAAIGKMMRIRELAHHMITTSSNLATNLLLDLVGVETVQGVLEHYKIEGIDFRRGVEDERAFAAGISNRVTASGLVALLKVIEEEKVFSPELSREMLDILHQQEFRNGIPGRLPREVRVAHKTGDISTIAHRLSTRAQAVHRRNPHRVGARRHAPVGNDCHRLAGDLFRVDERGGARWLRRSVTRIRG